MQQSLLDHFSGITDHWPAIPYNFHPTLRNSKLVKHFAKKHFLKKLGPAFDTRMGWRASKRGKIYCQSKVERDLLSN